MQYARVEVAEGRAYTYTFDGEPALTPGEIVVLPSNMVKDQQFTGRVLRLMDEPGTEIPLKAIVRRADDNDLL